MKKIVNTLLILIFLLIIAGCVIPAFLPKNIDIKTSHNFNNPISEVFLEFNDLENYVSWAPLISGDSINTIVNYIYPYKGEGSSFTWVNKKNDEIGKGEYKILKSKINKYIQSQIIFDNMGVIYLQDINFKSNGGKTHVDLQLKSDNFSYFNRIFAYFYSKNLEDNLTQSLIRLSSNLSKVNLNKSNLAIGDTEFIDFPGMQLLSIKNETTTNPKEIFNAAYKSLKKISQFLIDSLHYSPIDIKNPVLYYTKFDTLNHTATFYSGYSIKLDILPKNEMNIISVPQGKSIYTPIEGNFDTILKFRYALDKYSKENGIQTKSQYWEQFLDFPISYDDTPIKGKAYYLVTE